MRRVLALLLIASCAPPEPGEGSAKLAVPGEEGREKSAASVRAQRRMYDGAPPVIPHPEFGAACSSCHGETGIEVEGVGYSPPSPHERTAGLSAVSRCVQCHVFARTQVELVANAFAGLRQDLRPSGRQHALAPPVLPHRVFMRENCAACHSGPAAREEIRCGHPDRTRCLQCHVPQVGNEPFERP
jgi:cytochrome c-type protein NapB